MTKPTFDPDKYHKQIAVPVVDTFELVNEDWIDRTVAHMQKLEEEGNVCPLTLGHLDHGDKGKNDDETPVVGLARNWRKVVLPHLGPVVAADYWIERDKLDLVREHCGKTVRWSPDLWLKQHEIDPISLLGGTTPRRRLGTIQLARDGEEKPISLSRFSGGFEMPDDTKSLGMEEIRKELAELKDAVTKLLGAKDVPPEVPAAAPEAAPAGTEPEELSDEELEKLIAELEAGGGKGKEKPPEAPPEEKPVQASYAQPGPTNTKPAQMSRSEIDLQDRVAQLESENLKLSLSRKFDEFEKLGIQWVDEADKQADIDLLVALPENLRVVQLSRIEKKYAQAPVSGRPLDAVVQAARTTGKDVFTPDMQKQAVAYAAANKCSFGAAVKAIFNKYPNEFAEAPQ